MNPVNTGKFISELRKEKNITQKELADILGVTDKAVSKWETGRCYPDIETLEAVAVFFGVSVNDLLNGAETDAVTRETVADSNLISLMKRLEGINRKWRRKIFTAATLVVLIFSFVTFLVCLPVEVDSGSCAGGFSRQIYDEYAEALADEFFDSFENEPLYRKMSEGADIEWSGRLIYMELGVVYEFVEGIPIERTLRFIGKRYWFGKYSWTLL